MGWQHARRTRLRRRARMAQLREHAAEGIGATGHGRGTEGGDAVARQTRSHCRDRRPLVEAVDAINAVHMHVDEARNNVVALECEARSGMRGTRANLSDPSAVHDERAGREDAVRQHEFGACVDERWRGRRRQAPPARW